MMMKGLLCLGYIVAAAALDNGLGRVPQMGYNSWFVHYDVSFSFYCANGPRHLLLRSHNLFAQVRLDV